MSEGGKEYSQAEENQACFQLEAIDKHVKKIEDESSKMRAGQSTLKIMIRDLVDALEQAQMGHRS